MCQILSSVQLWSVPGPKAVMLYSGMTDVPLDLQFEELAAVASASRCSIYPVDAWGLRSPGEDAFVRAASAGDLGGRGG